MPFYSILLPLAFPWGVWHLLVGGIGAFEDYPLNWLNGNYSEYINAFWGRTYYASPIVYLKSVFEVLSRDLLPIWAWPMVLLGLGAVWRWYGWRAALFAVAVVAVLSAPVMIRMSPVFARYWYTSLPMLILLVTAGVGYLGSMLSRPQGAALLIVISIGIFPHIGNNADAAYARNITRHEREQRDYELFATVIDDSRGIISRDSRIQSLVPRNALYNNMTLNEQDITTYLKWSSDAEVQAVFQGHNMAG